MKVDLSSGSHVIIDGLDERHDKATQQLINVDSPTPVQNEHQGRRGPRDSKNCPGSNSTLEMAERSKNRPPKKVPPAGQKSLIFFFCKMLTLSCSHCWHRTFSTVKFQ